MCLSHATTLEVSVCHVCLHFCQFTSEEIASPNSGHFLKFHPYFTKFGMNILAILHFKIYPYVTNGKDRSLNCGLVLFVCILACINVNFLPFILFFVRLLLGLQRPLNYIIFDSIELFVKFTVFPVFALLGM